MFCDLAQLVRVAPLKELVIGSNPIVATKIKKMLEKDLDIYDVWEAPTGNLFIKLTDEYSIAIGPKGIHAPTEEWSDLKRTQFVKANNVTVVKKVGSIKWLRKKK